MQGEDRKDSLPPMPPMPPFPPFSEQNRSLSGEQVPQNSKPKDSPESTEVPPWLKPKLPAPPPFSGIDPPPFPGIDPPPFPGMNPHEFLMKNKVGNKPSSTPPLQKPDLPTFSPEPANSLPNNLPTPQFSGAPTSTQQPDHWSSDDQPMPPALNVSQQPQGAWEDGNTQQSTANYAQPP